MMRKPLSALGLSLTLFACSSQQPAAAPLAPPPPAEPTPVAVTPPPVETPKEAPKPAELTQEQVAKFYQDCWAAFNAKDWAKFSACYADTATLDAVDSGQTPLAGKDIVDKGAKGFATAFPDVTGEGQLILVNGTTVAGVWLVRGNHKGPLASPRGEIPATNKKIGYLFGHVVESKGGKTTREAQYSDGHTLLTQLGVAPPPARKVQEQGAAEKPVVLATNSDAEKANVETYKKYADAFAKKEAAGFEALLADDFIYSDQTMPADLVGKKEAMKGVKEAWKAFSDAKMTITSAWGAGDYVATTGNFSGTNDGPLPSMKLWKKTGKKVSVNYLSIAKIQGGKLKQEWVFSNGLAYADQLGLTPPPKAAPAAKAPGEAKKDEAGKKPAVAAAATGAKPDASKPAGGAAVAGGAAKTATPATPATPAAPGAAPKAATPPGPAAPKAAAPATPATPAKPAAPAK